MTITPNDLSQNAKYGLSSTARKKLIAQTAGTLRSDQNVAASLEDFKAAIQPGLITEAFATVFNVAAAGESMTFDIEINGVSILVAPVVYDATDTPAAIITLALKPIPLVVLLGNRFNFKRTYVAGGGPTPIGSSTMWLVVTPS